MRRNQPELSLEERIERRRVQVHEIEQAATKRGYVVTVDSVARNFGTWKLWYDGKLSPGHMVSQLGVRYTTPYPMPRWDRRQR